jgi:plastocyanin
MLRRSRLLAPVAALVLAAGCASAGEEEEGPAPEPVTAEDGQVTITGTDRLRFDVEEVTAEPGELTFELVCEEAVNHNLVIAGEVVAECAPGGTDTGSIELEAGTHRYLCNVPGHERTMQGNVTVG